MDDGSNNIAMTRNDVDINLNLFNVIKPWYDVIRHQFLSSDVEMVRVNVQLDMKQHCQKSGENHSSGEKHLIFNCVFKLDIF